MVSCYDKKNESSISDEVYMGIDKNPKIAFAKALTEYCERTLSRQSQDPVTKITVRSDGFAAYPVFEDALQARIAARENALSEATERYLWAKWWDEQVVCYQIKNALQTELELDFKDLIQEFDLVSIKEIQVNESKGEYRLSIFIAETRDGGFVTGGACSRVEDHMKRFNPAFGELLRHLIVVKNMLSVKPANSSFYECRLLGFGSGKWRGLVADRLKVSGSEVVLLPKLSIDQEVQHSLMEIVKIHRCLYEDQPPFIGGALERLCV